MDYYRDMLKWLKHGAEVRLWPTGGFRLNITESWVLLKGNTSQHHWKKGITPDMIRKIKSQHMLIKL